MGANALNEISDIELMKVYKNIELNKGKKENNTIQKIKKSGLNENLIAKTLNEISDIELMKVYKNIELNKYKESNNRNLLANAFNEISDIELMKIYKNIELDKIPTKIFEENKKL